MLNTYISSSNKLAPDVFIDASEISDDGITVYYHLENDETNWLFDQNILNNLNLNIFLNDTGSIESLNSLKNRTVIKNNYLYGQVTLPTASYDVFLSAYCGNKDVKGQKVTEQVLKINSPAKSDSLHFLNKNKDFRILNIGTLDSGSGPSEYKKYSQDLFVSYNTNKKASLGYIFNLEEYLHQNSKIYRAFEKIPYYKTLIFSASSISAEDITFYKKNISYPSDYQEISSDINLYRLDEANISSSYLLTTIDDNEDILNKSKYGVKLKIKISDYSYNILKSNILDPLADIKNYILKYKNLFESIFLNNKIENKYKFFFENKYQEEINNISDNIKKLSAIYAFYSKKYNKEEYASLFASIFHPLTTRIELFEKLLSNINILEASLSNLIGDISQPVLDETNNKTYDATFEHEFRYRDMQNREIYDLIDYNYDAYSGYEVFSSDTLDARKKLKKKGLDIYSVQEKSARKRLEADKYFTATDPSFYEKIKDFSISNLDLQKESFSFLFIKDLQNISFFNDVYMKIIQYNNNSKETKIPDYYYYELLKNNVYIKSIGARSNGGIGALFPMTIADPNEETKEESEQYITNSGVQYLYHLFDKNLYIDPVGVIQENAAVENNKNNYGSNFFVTKDVRNNIEMKPKMIIFYDNIFKDTLIASGATYSVYALEEAIVHPIFTQKLKLFNKYYIVLDEDNLVKAKTSTMTTEKILLDTLELVGLQQELSNSVESKYFNRNIENSVVLLTTSEI